jgi:hypothetical protein
MEYAISMDPRESYGLHQPTVQILEQHLVLTYFRSKSAVDVFLTLDQSEDLTTWQAGNTVIQPVAMEDLETDEKITVRLVNTTDAVPSGYIRLRATRK